MDVVAGGDGFGMAHDRGIDPTTGKVMLAQADANHATLLGDDRYHRAAELPLVDGVFIPHGGKEPVQLDSAGHVFTGFPKTDDRSWGYIWAGGILPSGFGEGVVFPGRLRGGLDYSLPWHSVLGMHANKGIAFDLEAIRHANPGCTIIRFLAAAGNSFSSEDESKRCLDDAWVFLDGRPVFRREHITVNDGELKIAVRLNDADRFLTLVATDGGNEFWADRVIFGDPRLVLLQSLDAERGTGGGAVASKADRTYPQSNGKGGAADKHDSDR